MHELSLAASILEIVRRNAAGRRVSSVHVEVGALRQVLPSALTFSFDVLVQGTELEGATLDVSTMPARGTCRRCRSIGEVHAFPLVCASCGALDIDIVAGEELMVASLELEDTADG
jgi:hydrogenase nickel incorporation protein HypA/HybF